MGAISLEEYRQHFSAAAGYLDFARYGPPSDVVAAASAASLETARREFADIDGLKIHESASLGIVAKMTGRPGADSVTFASSTSAAITLVAMALRGGPGGEVLVSPHEFPANVYPWVRAEAFGGPRVRWLECPEGKVTPDVVAKALAKDTVALAVSAVDFRTGYRADLAGLRDVLGDRLLLVDAIQGFGACDMEWSHADAVMAGGQKWLRSSWGTGFISLSSRGETRLGEGLAGWTTVEEPYRYDGELHETVASAQRFSLTNGDLVAASRLHAGLDLLQSVGVATVEANIMARVHEVRDAVRRHGGSVIVDLGDGELSGIVSFRIPGRSPAEVQEHLKSAGLLVTKHDSYVRASAHATTTSDTTAALSAALAGLVAT